MSNAYFYHEAYRSSSDLAGWPVLIEGEIVAIQVDVVISARQGGCKLQDRPVVELVLLCNDTNCYQILSTVVGQ